MFRKAPDTGNLGGTAEAKKPLSHLEMIPVGQGLFSIRNPQVLFLKKGGNKDVKTRLWNRKKVCREVLRASSLQGTAGRQYNAYCHFAKAVAEKEEIFSAGKCGGTGAVGQIFVSGMWPCLPGHLQKRNCEGGKQRWDKDGKDGKTAACFTGDFKGLPYAGISGTAAFYRRIGGIFCILYDRLCRTCFKHKRECICGFWFDVVWQGDGLWPPETKNFCYCKCENQPVGGKLWDSRDTDRGIVPAAAAGAAGRKAARAGKHYFYLQYNRRRILQDCRKNKSLYSQRRYFSGSHFPAVWGNHEAKSVSCLSDFANHQPFSLYGLSAHRGGRTDEHVPGNPGAAEKRQAGDVSGGRFQTQRENNRGRPENGERTFAGWKGTGRTQYAGGFGQEWPGENQQIWICRGHRIYDGA